MVTKINKYGGYVFGDIKSSLIIRRFIQVKSPNLIIIKILQFSELFHQAEPLSFNHATFNTLDALKALEDFHGQALKPILLAEMVIW